MKKELRIVSPNGHLGFAPTKEGSFKIAAATKPDYYCADSGSDDIGPTALGSDRSVSMYNWQKHDLELMLLASRKQDVPMIIGSAGDTGANSRVDMYVQMIKDLAKEHHLPPFKIAYFYSEVDKEFIRNEMENGIVVEGLDSRSNLTIEELEKTERIVAVAGVHPYIKALESGADVIIGGRSSDVAVFAAPAIHEGFPEANSYYLGKVLECASFCAEPYGAKESVIGTITNEDVKATAMHPEQRCTIASVAGHAMYERSNPYFEYFAGGMLDMTNCHYEQYDEKTCRITGFEYKPINGKIKVKLEGSGLVGEKFIGIAGVRDPYTIENIEKVIKFVEDQVALEFAGVDYHLNLKVFGKNGVMGDLEPIKEIKSHELAIIVEGITKDKVTAEELTLFATRQVFYAKLPEVKGTAGTAAYLIDDVLYAGKSFKWTMNHTIPVENALSLFDVKIEEVSSEENKVVN